MPDICALMRAATDGVTTGPDLAAVAVRARELQRQQQLWRASLVAAVALLIVPAVTGSWPAGRDALQPVPPAVTGIDGSPRPEPSPGVGVLRQPALGAPVSGPAVVGAAAAAQPVASRRPRATPAAVPGPRGAAQPATETETETGQHPTAPRPAGSYPEAPSCSIASTAMAPASSRSCQFTATGAGGYRLTFSSTILPSGTHLALVEVHREGRTTRYDAWEQACLNDVVRPGDLVTITVRQDERGHTDFEVGAGSTWGCRR